MSSRADPLHEQETTASRVPAPGRRRRRPRIGTRRTPCWRRSCRRRTGRRPRRPGRGHQPLRRQVAPRRRPQQASPPLGVLRPRRLAQGLSTGRRSQQAVVALRIRTARPAWRPCWQVRGMQSWLHHAPASRADEKRCCADCDTGAPADGIGQGHATAVRPLASVLAKLLLRKQSAVRRCAASLSSCSGHGQAPGPDEQRAECRARADSASNPSGLPHLTDRLCSNPPPHCLYQNRQPACQGSSRTKMTRRA